MDNKVIIYGYNSSAESHVAIPIDEYQKLPVDLYLAGSTIFSLSPFNAEFNADAELFDMVPVVNFGYIAGPATGTGDSTIFGRMKYCYGDSIEDPSSCLMVAELCGELVSNVPAVDTAASLTVAAGVPDNPVRVTGFGFTVTAVAAIVAPILVEVRSDTAGDNSLLWSGRVVVPAGESKEVWMPCNFRCPVDVQITVGAPGATNFVTASLEVNLSVGSSPT
jgi:hypothetical protein